MSKEYYLKISPHNHTTRYSECSSISALDIVRYSARANLDGIIITEHDCQWSDEDIAQLRKEALKMQICSPDFMIFAGREVTAVANGKHAHALVFGYRGDIPVDMDLRELCRQVHRQNAVVILAHPGRNGKKGIEDFWEYPADGIEYYS
jgi:hypothetical protein